MKKEKKIIKTIVISLSLLTSFSMVSCSSNPNKSEDSKEVAEDHNDAKFDNAKEKDAKFVVDAAEINLKEIQLGELAQNQGMSAEVKDLGKMMKEEHTKSFDELKTLAASKSITIPTTLTEDGQDDYKKLADQKGSDFDKKYTQMMVDGHKDAIKRFEDATKDVENTDIKSWAEKTLPNLRHHLDRSLTCNEKFK